MMSGIHQKLTVLTRLSLASLVMVVMAAQIPTLVMAEAMTDKELKALNEYANWVAKTCGPAVEPSGGAGSGLPDEELPGRDNREKIWNYLITLGFKPVEAAGIVGNIGAEGVYDPQNIEDPAGRTKDPSGLTEQNEGWGLIGFTPGASIFDFWAKASHVKVTKRNVYYISTQLDVVYGYMKYSTTPSGNNMLKEFQNKSTSPGNAAAAFMDLVENPGVLALGKRVQYANDAMRDFGHGGVASAVSGPGAPSGGACDCPVEGGAGETTGDIELTGKNNAERAFNYFIGPPLKLSPEAAAGLVGNFQQESGEDLNTRADNGSHTGIAQWDHGGRWAGLVEYERGKGRDPYDLGAQLDYVRYELTGSYKSSVLNPLKVARNTDVAAQIVNDHYEIVFDGTLPTRQANAREILKKYGGGGGGGAGGVGSDCFISGAGANGWNLKGPNSMVYYGQCDPKWATHPYGTGKSSICEGGCGITSMAMVVATLSNKGKRETPKTLADRYGDTYHVSGGTSWGLWPVAAKDYGLKMKDIGTDLNAAASTVKAGGLVIISVDPGAFTSGGHIMVIRAVDNKGRFLLADPNNDGNKSLGRGDTNNTPYTANFLRTQGSLKHLWAFNK